MTIIQQPTALLDFIYKHKTKGLSIGFVPTMGALHEGHLNLVEYCASHSDITVCSIFINPTQFNDQGDYRKYPDRLENDIRLLAASPAHVLFLPSVESIYPNGTSQLEQYELGAIETILEGKYRPGHFQGVCQVMVRLLNAVQPDFLFMGQKDYQQCMVIDKLLALTGSSTKLITCATVREADGLAMSSRNLRLNASQRALAPEIHKTLLQIGDAIKASPGEPIARCKAEAVQRLENKGFRVDYVEISDPFTLEPVDCAGNKPSLVILIAAFIGEIRLIDNLIVTFN